MRDSNITRPRGNTTLTIQLKIVMFMFVGGIILGAYNLWCGLRARM